jgi:hypothetical protein
MIGDRTELAGGLVCQSIYREVLLDCCPMRT